MALHEILLMTVGLLFVGQVFLGVSTVGAEICEEVVPVDTAAKVGEQAVLKCRLSSPNIAWTFCSKESGPHLIADNCELANSAVGRYTLDKSTNGCNLVVKNVTSKELGTYNCQDRTSSDEGHKVELTSKDVNLALNKNATQSSNYNADTLAVKAVDGVGAITSCSHTLSAPSNWWAVDLGQKTSVGHVRLTSRNDVATNRLTNFIIGLTDVSPWTTPPTDVSKSSVCKYFAGYPPAGIPINIYCDPDTAAGRYLFVLMTLTDFLTLCELEVYY